jgi:hypothetical protein
MKLNCNSFFDGKFTEINLNEFFKDKDYNCKRPDLAQKDLDNLGYLTYGGYGENRCDMFKGSYLDKTENYIHLGIDINAPAGTSIICPFDCLLLSIFIDKDTDIGWGGRLILMRNFDLPLLVLGHLEPRRLILDNFKSFIKTGSFLGRVGTWPTNGNVFQHLHIQCIKIENVKDFDGYGTKKDLKDNPNPFEVEF